MSLKAGCCALRSNACCDRLRLRQPLEVGKLRSFPAFEPDAQLRCALVGCGGQGAGPLDGAPKACPPGCRCRDPEGRPEAASQGLRWVGTLLRHDRSPPSALPVRVLARGAAARGVGSPRVRRPLAVRVPPKRARGPALGVSAKSGGAEAAGRGWCDSFGWGANPSAGNCLALQGPRTYREGRSRLSKRPSPAEPEPEGLAVGGAR